MSATTTTTNQAHEVDVRHVPEERKSREVRDPPRWVACHRRQGVRRSPPERSVHRPADRSRSRRDHPAVLRRRSHPLACTPGDRRSGDLPRALHRRLAGHRHPQGRCLRGDGRAAARPRLRVRRRERREVGGNAAAAPRPADLPRRRHQRQVRGRDVGHRARPGLGRRPHRRVRDASPRDRPAQRGSHPAHRVGRRHVPVRRAVARLRPAAVGPDPSRRDSGAGRLRRVAARVGVRWPDHDRAQRFLHAGRWTRAPIRSSGTRSSRNSCPG